MIEQIAMDDVAPIDGALPESVSIGAEDRAFGIYIHVPFCKVRCGYCDFNTYTAKELLGAKQSDYAWQAIAELKFARNVITQAKLPNRGVDTVFFGGGTPSLLPAQDLINIKTTVANEFGLAAGTEITVEANPDSVNAEYLEKLAESGFTRISFGMQSAVPHVLAALDRTHNPERVPEAVSWARHAGLDVSLDLIYGSPGESIADWQKSLQAAIEMSPDHLSAYSLIVEDGTKMSRQIRRGETVAATLDLQAEMYELADDLLTAAGYEWYEISNWAKNKRCQSKHNIGYWRSDDWWGIGPGAHSHIGGVRWWNAKHPTAYAKLITQNHSPAIGRENLSENTRAMERLMLLSRLREGLQINRLPVDSGPIIASLIAEGTIDAKSALAGKMIFTRKGRLLADAVILRLLESAD